LSCICAGDVLPKAVGVSSEPRLLFASAASQHRVFGIQGPFRSLHKLCEFSYCLSHCPAFFCVCMGTARKPLSRPSHARSDSSHTQ